MKYRPLMTACLCGLLLIQTPLSFRVCFAQTRDNAEKDLFFVAQKAFDDGFYDIALRYIDQFLAEFPQSPYIPKAQLLKGQCFFFKNQYLKAFDIFQQLRTNDELEDAVLFWMGETHLKGSDYRQALDYFKQVLADFPDSPYVPQAYYSQGWAYYEQGDYTQAEDSFNNLLRSFPEHMLIEDSLFRLGEIKINTGKNREAIDILETYLQKFPNSQNALKAMFYLAENLYYVGDPLKAVTFYAKVAESNASANMRFMSRIGMGWCYIKLKKFDLAEENFKQAETISTEEKLNSQDEVYFGKGNLLTQTEHYPEALKTFDLLINDFPKSPRVLEARLNRANIYFELNDYSKASQQFMELIEHLRSLTGQEHLLERSYYGLAWTYLKMGDTKKAVSTFETIIEQSKSNIVKASALSQIGDAYQEVEKYDLALRTYDQVLRRYPDSLYADYAQFQQGVTFLHLNNIEAAKISFQSLQTNFPKSRYLSDAQYYLGIAHFRTDGWALAAEHFKRFLEENPYSHLSLDAQYLTALAYFNNEDYDHALEYLSKLISNPNTTKSLVQSARLQQAKSLYLSKKTKDALKAFEAIISEFPGSDAHQEAQLWVADHYFEVNELDRAISLYQTFLDTFPGSPHIDVVHYDIGQAYQAQRKFEKALEHYRRIQPENKDIYAKTQIAIAEIFSSDFQQEKAIETYQQIAQTLPDYSRDALIQIAEIYKQKDRPEEALKIYQTAVDTPQGSSTHDKTELLFLIGDLLEQMNKTDQAAEEYLKAIYLGGTPTSWTIKSYLRTARIFEDQQKWQEAQAIYKKLIALNTEESKYAQERLEWVETNIKTED
jgi:tetratricopeptide (TPR) repeat protein